MRGSNHALNHDAFDWSRAKKEGKSKYQCVYPYKDQRTEAIRYIASIKRKAFRMNKGYKTERKAAIAVDMKLISHGLEPVNILKRK